MPNKALESFAALTGTCKEMQSINSFKFCFILFLLLLFSGCTTQMKMAPVDLKNLTPNEGVVVGSLIVKGGKDLIGRTKWELSTENLSDSSAFSKIYSITANRDEGEEIFVSKMPAGDYSFSDLTQPFSTFHVKHICHLQSNLIKQFISGE